MNWITGISRDGWPTAIPLDRVKELRVDPDDKAAVIEFRDEPDRSETLKKAMICNEDGLTIIMGSLADDRNKDHSDGSDD